MKLSIIIVSYNVKFFLEQCLHSIINATNNIDAEIIVVDNHSVDNSSGMVKKKFPHVHLISNTENIGFSKANNQAIRISKGEFVLLLNPDTLVEEDAIRKAMEFIQKDSDIGAVSVQMIDGQGKFLNESKRGIPDFRTSLCKFLGLHKLFPKSKIFNNYYLGYKAKDERHEIKILVGAFMFVNKKILDKVGLFDEQFFMYWEDTDLSMRINEKGYKNYYLGDIKMIHYKGESNKRHTIRFTLRFNRSMIAFVEKHFNKHILFLPLIRIATIVKVLVVFIKNFFKTFLSSIIDFCLIYLGILIFTDFWEQNYASYPFTELFTDILIPIYIMIWLISLFLNGAYEKPFKINRVARGVILGLLIIATFSNFFNAIRFSRTVILFSSISVFFTFIITRFFYRILFYKDLDIAEKRSLNLLLLSEKSEFQRAKYIVDNSKHNIKLVGYVNSNGKNGALGKETDIKNLIKKYKIDELVFSSKDLSIKEIINKLISLKKYNLKFKVLPENSDFLIGSNSRETLGDYYSFDSNWELNKKRSKRNKRIVDFVFSFLFLLLTPFIIWFSNSPSKFLKNMLNILKGHKTFVGFSEIYKSHFPNIKKGILTPISYQINKNFDSDTIRNINMRYAKDYNAWGDIYIILRCLNQLG